MSRVRAEALALVNWRGVFYERYELDRHVSALEGDNGAGKTTVMIAAYVVLLPDMTRLRFTNLGETGATGGDKGIWGRLGELGRPSYAALTFRLPRGERVLAGVHLERKGEPTVEPTPFIVTGLPDDARLQDVLLLTEGAVDQVPELGELRDGVARLGARLQVFPSARDYFAALFDLGITPMRLGTDEERNKLNEMLKTSMTGGMSRGLLSELRSFLLKEEGGLAETLQRMRANLDACRRTRTEVVESQRLEREISAVQDAGEAMFAAAVAATRQRADELSRRAATAAAQRRDAEVRHDAAQDALEAARVDLAAAVAAKDGAAAEVTRADAWARRVDEAVRWAREAETRAAALAAATAVRADALATSARAEAALTQAEAVLSTASADRERAAAGLADLQAGLEELHRRAAAHRRACVRLADARALLERPTLAAEALGAAEADATERLTRVDAERRDLTRALDDATARRAEHAEALAALERVCGAPVDPAGAHAVGRETVALLHRWRDRASRQAAIAQDLRAVEADAARRVQALDRARALDLAFVPGAGRATAEAALDEVERGLVRLDGDAREADGRARDAAQAGEAARADVTALEARTNVYAELAGLAARLAEAVSAPVSDRATLDLARLSLRSRLREAEDRATSLAAHREALLAEAQQLLHGGGSYPPELLQLRDELAAELLAAHFDDAPVAAAGRLEARLGPLAQALVVADVEAATARVRARPEALASVWLVAEDAALDLGPERVAGDGAHGDDVVVDDGPARRVTRVPARPTLGRAARARRSAELAREAQEALGPLEAARHERRVFEAAQGDADALLAGVATWLAGDPADDLAAARRAARDADERASAARAAADNARRQAASLGARRQALVQLLPDAALLDAVDLDERVAALRAASAAAEEAARALSRAGDAAEILERGVDALRHLPWTDDQLSAARAQVSALAGQRDALRDGLEALAFVGANREALAWGDAEARLAEDRGLVPALQAQLDQAVAAVEAAREAERATRVARDAASASFNAADAQHATALERHREAVTRLAEAGVDAPTEVLLAEARDARECALAALKAVDAALGQRQTDLGRAQEAAQTAASDLEVARGAEEDEVRAARPAIEGWERLRQRVAEAGLLEAAQSARYAALYELGNVNAWQEATTKRALLLERLQTGRSAAEAVAAVERALTAETTGVGYLDAWLAVRDWLRTRLPAQIADVAEPQAALTRFREHLAALVERLRDQEQTLRGASEDVARGIDVQVRKAQGRVRRLSEHLVGVRFGSIEGVRVRMQRVERMEQVLRALRSGEAQGLLFQGDVAFEEALEEIFRRYGGGRTGAQRMLDYREYLHLQVEVQRQDSAGWEVANPTRLSTGEAIGVGAALMMVVLTEWERDANLLRGRRAFGSMRFLFLDEANRLDHANLRMVFDLCRNLDLQLLVASPEVARAEGCTVFRLVRLRGEDGREVVQVSGRRLVTAEG